MSDECCKLWGRAWVEFQKGRVDFGKGRLLSKETAWLIW